MTRVRGNERTRVWETGEFYLQDKTIAQLFPWKWGATAQQELTTPKP